MKRSTDADESQERARRSALQRRVLRGAIAAGAGASIVVAATREARADIALGGDFHVGLPVGTSPTLRRLETGAGFDLRFGYRFRIPYQPLWVTPELVAGYTDLSAHVVRVRPGVRVSFGRFVVPYAYGHIGWGFTTYDGSLVSNATSASFVSSNGLALDVGAGVDFAVVRRLMVGALLGYNVVSVGQVDADHPSFHAKWMSFGLGATLFF